MKSSGRGRRGGRGGVVWPSGHRLHNKRRELPAFEASGWNVLEKLSIVAAETRQALLWQIGRTTSLSVMSKQGCESWPFGGFGAIPWTCKTIFTLVMSTWAVAYIKHEMMFRSSSSYNGLCISMTYLIESHPVFDKVKNGESLESLI